METAFAIQQSLSPEPGAAAAIEISFELQTPPLAEKGASRGEGFPIEIGQATRALLHGYAGDALKYLQSRKRSGKSPVRIELPVHASGISTDEVLLVDHSQLDLSDDAGARMYRGVNSDVLVFRTVAPSRLLADQLNRRLICPFGPFKRSGYSARGPQMKYSLTLTKVIARHLIAALDGELRAADMGRCATRLAQDGGTIQVHCIHVGSAPFCFSATLYGPRERHNPEVFGSRDPDYRPYLPSLTELVSSYSLDVPVRDRFGLVEYSVDPSELARSYLLIKIYGVREHFTRSAVIPRTKLAELVAVAK